MMSRNTIKNTDLGLVQAASRAHHQCAACNRTSEVRPRQSERESLRLQGKYLIGDVAATVVQD
jgi:hypothetical protein